MYSSRWEYSGKFNTRLFVLYLSCDSYQELYTFIQTKWQCLSVLLYFAFKEVSVSIQYSSWKFNALSTHLLNKQIVFFDKMWQQYYCSITTLAFYYYIPNHSFITTYFTHYGSYRTVVPFDLPTQNTINCNMRHCISVTWYFIWVICVQVNLIKWR